MKNQTQLLQKCLEAFERISDRLHYEDGEAVTTLTSREIEETYLDAIENLVELEEAIKEAEELEGKIDFKRINNDVNGNPRYVCHFLNFITDKDRGEEGYFTSNVGAGYSIALKRAKQLGGRKFHNKQYGGGIVFQSYDTSELEKQIKEIVAKYK